MTPLLVDFMPRSWRTRLWAACALGIGMLQPAQAADAPPPFKFGLEAGAQSTISQRAFWGLAQTFAPASDYKTSITWLEVYAKPYVDGSWSPGPDLRLNGRLSVIGSGTLSKDVFQHGNTGRVLPEDAFLNLRWTTGDAALTLSGGSQQYTLGQSLVLAVGAGNAIERGAALLAPRRAWEMTGIARVESGGLTGEIFYLNPNELKSVDTGTQLAGGRIAWSPARNSSVGAAWFKAWSDAAIYPRAPVSIIPNGRDGLETLDLHWSFHPGDPRQPGFFFEGEAALQRNPRIDMRATGWGLNLGYHFTDWPFAPRISISPRRFTGENPATPALERFDALFYDSTPDTWSSGGQGGLAFYNTNLRVVRLRLDLILSPVDYFNFNYWFLQADQLNSPLQYGQAGRLSITNDPSSLISGVPKRNLSQELYAEYTRVVSANLFVTAGLAAGFPQSGVKALVPQGAKLWYGGLVSVSLRY